MENLARGYRAKNAGYGANELNGVGIGLNTQTLLIIKLPDSRALRIISRSLFLALFLLALPSLASVISASRSAAPLYEPGSDPDISEGFRILPILLRDLVDEGLIKKGHKGFVVGSGIREIEDDFEFLRDAGIDLLAEADLRDHRLFDFVFAPNFRGVRLIDDGVLKDDSLVILPLGIDPSQELRLLRNFKIVYLRRFENTVVAMRKARGLLSSGDMVNSRKVPCGVTPEKKKAALKGLEDVYLEPPKKSSLAFTSRKIKFLPDLLKDSLEEYPRRVFISDNWNAIDWFYRKYPMRDQEFEIYDLEVGMGEMAASDWMTKNVRAEDYVVMKAEAQLVEEMLRDKTLYLVDELFLECKNQWQDGEERSKRAYWQCLTLYGKVRDEGIAVHQWWG